MAGRLAFVDRPSPLTTVQLLVHKDVIGVTSQPASLLWRRDL